MVHAYYEFQHVELSNVGSGKKKVLKPPGGGSSNIFSGDESPCRPTRANRMASNIALGDCGSETASVNSSPPSTPRKPGSPNPVTNEDFVDKKVVNTASVAAAPPQQKRSRIPPGGYSTKLW